MRIISDCSKPTNYQCDQCDFKATSKTILQGHMSTIHEGHLYKCDQCDFTTTTQTVFHNHMISSHNKYQVK